MARRQPAAGTRQGEVESFGFWIHETQVRRMAEGHVHADLELNYLLEGSLRYFHHGGFVDLPVGRLTVFWAAVPHQLVETAPGSRFFCGCIPLAMALRWRIQGRLIARLLAGEMIAAPAEDGDADRHVLGRWVRELGERDDELRRIVAMELHARMLRLGRHHSAGAPQQRGDALGAVERMAAYIAAHYAEDIDSADIATAAGLHPKYAATLFRRGCGMTPGRYLLRLRLAHAKHLLIADTGRTVASIAVAAGFGSQSRFYEAFEREFGYSPGAFRKVMAMGVVEA